MAERIPVKYVVIGSSPVCRVNFFTEYNAVD